MEAGDGRRREESCLTERCSFYCTYLFQSHKSHIWWHNQTEYKRPGNLDINPQVSVLCFLNRKSTVLCKNPEALFISLYFARKIRKRCSDLLAHARTAVKRRNLLLCAERTAQSFISLARNEAQTSRVVCSIHGLYYWSDNFINFLPRDNKSKRSVLLSVRVC